MKNSSKGSDLDANRIDLGFGGLSATVGDHIGHFYRNQNEMVRVVGPYFAAGLEAGDQCTLLCPARNGDTFLQGLASQGVEVEAALSSGQLSLHEGLHDADAMVELFSAMAVDAEKAGYRLIRICGDMAWGLEKMPSTDELVEWEAKYDLHIAPEFPFLALCQYHLGAFGGEVVLDALKTHPLCIVGELVHENPFYTSPEKFLDELGIRSGRETLGKRTAS